MFDVVIVTGREGLRVVELIWNCPASEIWQRLSWLRKTLERERDISACAASMKDFILSLSFKYSEKVSPFIQCTSGYARQ
jgi:hypothetical protein